MNWKLVPLPAVIILLMCAGVIRIREQGGEGDGFLMAGAGLILAGLWACMEIIARIDKPHPDEPDKAFWEKVLDRRREGQIMSEHPVAKSLHAQDEAIDDLQKEIVEEEIQEDAADEEK